MPPTRTSYYASVAVAVAAAASWSWEVKVIFCGGGRRQGGARQTKDIHPRRTDETNESTTWKYFQSSHPISRNISATWKSLSRVII